MINSLSPHLVISPISRAAGELSNYNAFLFKVKHGELGNEK